MLGLYTLLSVVLCLELLADYEVELAAAHCALAVWAVETVAPVDTQQTNHWQVDAQTCTQ